MPRGSWLAKPVVGYVLIALFCGYFLAGIPDLEIGSPSMMGPGFFPLILALILLMMALGGIVWEIVSGSLGEHGSGGVEWRPLIFVCLAILAFGLLVRPLGLVPAAIGGAFVARLADGSNSLWRGVALSLAVGLLSWLIFVFGLGLPIAALRLPF